MCVLPNAPTALIYNAFMKLFDDLPSKKLAQLMKKPSVHLEYEVVRSPDNGVNCTGL